MATDNGANDKSISNFLVALKDPENLASSLLWSNDSNQFQVTESILITTCQTLFQKIEQLGNEYTASVHGMDSGSNPLLLSGMDSLYTELGSNENAGKFLDAETIWGQVDLQNENLLKLLKASLKKLTNAAEATKSGKSNLKYKIQLLEDIPTTDDESQSENSIQDSVDENIDIDEHDNDSDDSQAERIKSRMARVMREMENESDGGDDHNTDEEENDVLEGTEPPLRSKQLMDDDSEQDPAAETLNDGFFSISEMEAFADEEEGYLPDDAYGTVDENEEKRKSTDKRSFHQKQRDGDITVTSDDDDSDMEDDESPAIDQKKLTRRKNYRADDEIEALLDMYNEPSEKDDIDEDDPINMTAADMYGNPNKKRLENWKSKRLENSPPKKEDDGDSWDNDFDDNVGWGGSDVGSKSDDDGTESEDHDEDVSMNDKLDKPNKGSGKVAPTKQLEKIRLQTEQLESDMLAEKPWQMIGEAGSLSRPVDSLLDSTPEFEVATKIAPAITVEHTLNIEEMIKQRILNEDWDDVIPRELPDVGWHKKNGELPEVSQEKSKLGLGELYEREYLKKVAGYDKEKTEKESEEEKMKNEMKALFANLCSKLDALSNYHFAPRPIADEADIRPVAQPAIAMEEVLPLHVSNARGVAPEEVYAPKRGRDSVLRADSELEQEDRKRQRRSKKESRRKARKEKAADEKLISRLQPGLGLNNPYEKRKAREELSVARAGGRVVAGSEDKNSSDYGASTTFFQRMQAEAEQSISSKKFSSEKPNENGKGKQSSSYKL